MRNLQLIMPCKMLMGIYVTIYGRKIWERPNFPEN